MDIDCCTNQDFTKGSTSNIICTLLQLALQVRFEYKNMVLASCVRSIHLRISFCLWKIIAIYCHPLEHFMCNLSPLLLGPIVMKSHVLTLWIWITIGKCCLVFISWFIIIFHSLCSKKKIGQTNAINSHCGFHLPLFPSPLAHDYHHEVFNKNYGPVGVLDWLHGTAGSREMALEKKKQNEAAKLKSN